MAGSQKKRLAGNATRKARGALRHGGTTASSDARVRKFTDASAGGGFDYLFPEAPDIRDLRIDLRALDALGEAMVEQPGDPVASNSISIPPVVTYAAQFVGHDIMSLGIVEPTLAGAGGQTKGPIERRHLRTQFVNLRRGSLSLDSLYDGPPHSEVDGGPEAAGRASGDPALMEIPRWEESRTARRVPPTSEPRNGSNLITHQFHLAMLRVHNRVALACDRGEVHALGRPAVFDWARRELCHLYQWLVLNDLLKQVCGGEIVDDVLACAVPLYARFRAPEGGRSGPATVPIEFFGAAFRFGHSMVRGSYDYNAVMGHAPTGQGSLRNSAPLGLLLGTDEALAEIDTLAKHHCPTGEVADLGIDWPRFTSAPSADHPDRAARKIDTRISAALSVPGLADDADTAAPRHLACLNLRSGYRFNLPTGQAAIAGTNARLGRHITPLSPRELRSGPTGGAIGSGVLSRHTPLWFYLLKEAEVRAGGETLGPLGARIVAETVAGLVQSDPSSYWHRPGTDRGRWCPFDSAHLLGAPVRSFGDLLECAEAHSSDTEI
ncbi:MAG: peroxidase family protein [Pseudomonadota bacterium]